MIAYERKMIALCIQFLNFNVTETTAKQFSSDFPDIRDVIQYACQ